MKKLLCAVIALFAICYVKAQNKYQYTADIANIKDDKVAISLLTPAINTDTAVFSFPKAIPGSYARKDFGRFIDNLAAFDKDGKKLKIKKINDNQYQISNAKALSRITYLVNDTWDHKHDDFIFQPGGSNIDAGVNVVMNNHAFYGYFEGYSTLPYQITVTKPESFFASTHLDVKHVSPGTDVIEAKDYVYLADNPIIYCKPDTTSFYAGKSKINVSVYAATGKIKSAQVASYLKPITFALAKFFNGLPVPSYQFLYYFDDPKKALTDKKKGEGGYGALEHNYSSLYYLPEMDYEKDLISMINDVSTHEFLHVLTPLNLHSYEIADFNFTDPKMSKQLWMYEGVTEYFAHLVELQNGLVTEKTFFNDVRTKMNNAVEYGDFSMTEMSKNVMNDTWQKKYESVYSRGALIGLLLDIYIRDKTAKQKDLKSVIVHLTHKYGPGKPFEDDRFLDEFIAASHPDVKLFIDKYIAGGEPLPYQELLNKVGYEYAPSKNVDAYYPGKMGLKYDKPTNSFAFTSVGKNPLDIKENDILMQIENDVVSPDNIDAVWDKYFDENTQFPSLTIKVKRNGEEKTLSGDIYNGHFAIKNFLGPLPQKTAAQEAMLNALEAK